MRKTIIAMLLIAAAILMAAPAMSDTLPNNRVFGCAADTAVGYGFPGPSPSPEPSPFPDPVEPSHEYIVIFGGDPGVQLCEDQINALTAKGYVFRKITPGAQVGFSGPTPDIVLNAPAVVHYMTLKRWRGYED